MRFLFPDAYWVALPALLATACKGEAERDRRAEAARVLHAIDELREAPNEDKAPRLLLLERQECSHQEVCAVLTTCVRAYQTHVSALAKARTVRATLGADAAATELKQAALLTEAARSNLEQARSQIGRCTELHGELSRSIAR